jgi:Na+-driven multidrug efflux pump
MTRTKVSASEPAFDPGPISLRRITSFFVPLGISASLVTLSHTIIQRTLASSDSPELTIAAYTIAMSIFTITERPAVLLRQTCTALVEDRISFRAMKQLMLCLLLFTLLFGGIISYTPVGDVLFRSLFNADDALIGKITSAYRFLMFVTIFSAIRCLYHGVIIRNMNTKWLTIGMVMRLIGMYIASLFFLAGESVITATTGAIIFLIGMMIEAIVSYLEGRGLVKRLPKRIENSKIHSLRSIFPFYVPLLYSSALSVIIAPSINAMLGKTSDIALSIASYALALNVAFLFTSFFNYTHQIVLNFYSYDPRAVRRFASVSNLIPAAAIAVLVFTPLGSWFMSTVMSVNGQLLEESLSVLRMFLLLAFVIPWVDYCNGLVLLHKKTAFMAWSQAGNVAMTILALIILIAIEPGWNGTIGALAQSFGVLAELGVLIFLLLRSRRRTLS